MSGDVFNVASGERLSVRDVARALQEVLGKPLAIRHTAPRPGDVRDTLADISRARDRLGSVPTVGLAEGLRRPIAAFAV